MSNLKDELEEIQLKQNGRNPWVSPVETTWVIAWCLDPLVPNVLVPIVFNSKIYNVHKFINQLGWSCPGLIIHW